MAKRQATKSVGLGHDFDFVNHEKSVFVFQIFRVVYNDLTMGFSGVYRGRLQLIQKPGGEEVRE